MGRRAGFYRDATRTKRCPMLSPVLRRSAAHGLTAGVNLRAEGKQDDSMLTL